MAFVLSAFADEIGADLDLQIEWLKKTGVNFVEYRSSGGKNVSDHTLEEGKAALARLKDAGLALSALGSPIGKIDIEADFAPHLDLFKHTLDLAETMETRYIRLFSFFIPQDKDAALYRNKVMDQMHAFVEAAKGRPVTLLHENEKAIYGDVPERCLDILTTVNDPQLRATYDFSNFVQCGCDNKKAWELLKDYVVYFHFKDSLYTNEHAERDQGRQITGNGHRPLGLGDGCCLEILADAKARGFDGFASLEPHLGEEFGATGVERYLAAHKGATELLNKLG